MSLVSTPTIQAFLNAMSLTQQQEEEIVATVEAVPLSDRFFRLTPAEWIGGGPDDLWPQPRRRDSNVPSPLSFYNLVVTLARPQSQLEGFLRQGYRYIRAMTLVGEVWARARTRLRTVRHHFPHNVRERMRRRQYYIEAKIVASGWYTLIGRRLEDLLERVGQWIQRHRAAMIHLSYYFSFICEDHAVRLRDSNTGREDDMGPWLREISMWEGMRDWWDSVVDDIRAEWRHPAQDLGGVFCNH